MPLGFRCLHEAWPSSFKNGKSSLIRDSIGNRESQVGTRSSNKFLIKGDIEKQNIGLSLLFISQILRYFYTKNP